jgi:hypothetical protein
MMPLLLPNKRMGQCLSFHAKLSMFFSFSDNATKVMIELLGTYTADTASQAREDAQKCAFFFCFDLQFI